MRKLSTVEISHISGADKGTTFAGSAGATLGAGAGAFLGGRVGLGTPGAAIGSGLGALAGESVYNAGKNALKSWDPSGFQGSSFFPQTPS